MVKELYELLESMPEKTIMLVNHIIVYGVEEDTVWKAKCIGITRPKPHTYTLILANTKQFYRPMRRTNAVFQYQLYKHVRLTLLRKIILQRKDKVYVY